MNNIYIIEDNLAYAQLISEKFDKYLAYKEKEYFNPSIRINTEFTKFLNNIQSRNGKDIYVLDIDLNDELDGLQLAEAIRKKDTNSYIIYNITY